MPNGSEIEREPDKAPPARGTDPQKPGEPLQPGPQGESGTTGPAGGVVPEAGPAAPGGRESGPDDRGRGSGDHGAL